MKSNQTYILKILVGLSLVLLLVFLTFWNMENYKRTKIALEQDLNDQMKLACSDYSNNMVQSIFRIITNDSVSLKGATSVFNFESDSTMQVDSLILTHDIKGNHFPRWTGNKNGALSITRDSSNKLASKESIIVWQSEESTNLRFNYSSDTIIEVFDKFNLKDKWPTNFSKTSQSIPTVYSKLDSLFSKRLVEQNILIPHKLSKDSISASNSIRSIIIPFDYQSFGFTEKPIALFENYQSYIWGKMSSSILMSLLLFSVVALSFFVLLNTWLKQKRLSLIKNEFVSNMTHELKTPISTIGVALEALENYGGIDDPIKRAEYLSISKNEVNRLNILVDKVLKMSTIDQSENILQVDELDIKSMTETMLNSMQLHFEKHGVNLDYSSEDDDFMIKGDKTHLTNVLYNLIDNAIKYSGENPTIGLKLTTSPTDVIIMISDKGIGINKEFQSKVFDRFFRVPTADIHNVKGYGLGLHYVDTVIKKHGGKLELESEEGKGSLFTIKLPKA